MYLRKPNKAKSSITAAIMISASILHNTMRYLTIVNESPSKTNSHISIYSHCIQNILYVFLVVLCLTLKSCSSRTNLVVNIADVVLNVSRQRNLVNSYALSCSKIIRYVLKIRNSCVGLPHNIVQRFRCGAVKLPLPSVQNNASDAENHNIEQQRSHT